MITDHELELNDIEIIDHNSKKQKERKEEFDIWLPVDCIGEVGAAIVPVILGMALAAAKKGYAPGNGVLCHFGNDDGQRAAMFLSYSNTRGT